MACSMVEEVIYNKLVISQRTLVEVEGICSKMEMACSMVEEVTYSMLVISRHILVEVEGMTYSKLVISRRTWVEVERICNKMEMACSMVEGVTYSKFGDFSAYFSGGGGFVVRWRWLVVRWRVTYSKVVSGRFIVEMVYSMMKEQLSYGTLMEQATCSSVVNNVQ
ncbi:hypothetical protein HAX54_053181 [Datura stramonium]|uniref:Uncharacterized protein n=1 Tax=Datura stramonium TaxID=4076 RepID=A0ABS8T0J2_DATST|nr:hypothetical protein [Datura stramonium]